MFIVAGVIAALIAYIFNRYYVQRIGNKAIFLLVPAIEEISKTLSAYLLGANILLAHIVFGAIEALYDGVNSSKKIALAAAIASVITHTLLGMVTYWVFKSSSNLSAAIISSALLHFGYNYFIVKS
jgi:hypothetical protein